MAGDWIKMRTGLATSPKVVRLSSALKADRFRIIGGLHSAWCLFDAHSEDGILSGYTPSVLDDLIGWPGFAEAMIAVSWLEDDGENLILPRFEDHNGQSAKRRAQDADRKRVLRMSAIEADSSPQNVCPRGEENREEKKEQKTVPAEAGASNCPQGEIVAAYHRLLPTLRRVREWNEQRQKLLRRRWLEEPERQTVTWWEDFFTYVSKSDFLMGRTNGDRPFDCDLEWLIRPTNFVKVVEGKYENKAA